MSDPTGTARLRRSFLAEANRRLANVRRVTHTVLVERDLMSAKNDPLASLFGAPGHRLASFMQWFESTVSAQLTSVAWWEPFLERAYASGADAGGELVGRPPRGFSSVPAVYRELAGREFAGIASTMVQQVSRSAGMAALRERKPLPLYQQVLAVLKKVGQNRMRMAVNTMTVQLHNAARLDYFREAGITQVGVMPERLEPAKPSRFLRKHDHAHVRDASAEEELRKLREKFERQRQEAEAQAARAEVEAERARAALERQVAAGLAGEELQRLSREQAEAELKAARAQARAEVEAIKAETAVRNAELKAQSEAVKEARRAERKLGPRPQEELPPRVVPEWKPPSGFERVKQLIIGKPTLPERLLRIAAGFGGAEFLNVQTAGDDRVCQVCQDLSDEGPYSLFEAMGLLPAHVDCRCAWVPFTEGGDDEDEE